MLKTRRSGETEENLARVFEQADRRDWILFFAEAFLRRFEAVV
jgi:hypothetical protein